MATRAPRVWQVGAVSIGLGFFGCARESRSAARGMACRRSIAHAPPAAVVVREIPRWSAAGLILASACSRIPALRSTEDF